MLGLMQCKLHQAIIKPRCAHANDKHCCFCRARNHVHSARCGAVSGLYSLSKPHTFAWCLQGVGVEDTRALILVCCIKHKGYLGR
jgi:hypothetical protein